MILGIVASSSSSSVKTYVFDGTTNSYLSDETATPTLMDSIVNQTVFVRARKNSTLREDGFIGELTNDTRLFIKTTAIFYIKGQLRDTGTSYTGSNNPSSKDLQWHTYALTYDGVDCNIYQDGILAGGAADPDFTARIDGRVLTVGMSDYTSGAIYLNGEVSDFQFYNRALTATELLALHADLTDFPTDHATTLEANFADQKTLTTWTDEITGYELTNKGDVAGNSYTYGSEIVTDGLFTNNGTSWTVTAPSTIASNQANVYSVAGEASIVEQDCLTIGNRTTLTFEIISITGQFDVSMGSGVNTTFSTIGIKTITATPTATWLQFKSTTGNAVNAIIDNISAREIQ